MCENHDLNVNSLFSLSQEFIYKPIIPTNKYGAGCHQNYTTKINGVGSNKKNSTRGYMRKIVWGKKWGPWPAIARPWPMAVAIGHGHWPCLLAMFNGQRPPPAPSRFKVSMARCAKEPQRMSRSAPNFYTVFFVDFTRIAR